MKKKSTPERSDEEKVYEFSVTFKIKPEMVPFHHAFSVITVGSSLCSEMAKKIFDESLLPFLKKAAPHVMYMVQRKIPNNVYCTITHIAKNIEDTSLAGSLSREIERYTRERLERYIIEETATLRKRNSGRISLKWLLGAKRVAA